GRRVVVASGDVTAYAAGARGRGVTRVFVLDAATGARLSSIDVSGKPATKNGERYDSGFVQSVLCRGGATARVYLGGSFTRVFGKQRRRSAMITLVRRGSGLKRSLTSWQVPSSSPVTGLAPSPKQVLVSTGGRLLSVSPSTADVRWTVRSVCGGVKTATYAAGSVYVGGFFNAVKGTDGTVARNHGVAKVDPRTGRVASRKSFRTAIPRNRGCSSYSGANPGAIVHDAKRKRVILCEGGIKNGVRAISRRTGRQAWFRETDGDAQACAIVEGRLFVGFHRSKGNIPLDSRGCGSRNCGTMGAFLSLADGHQVRWMPASADFFGRGRNRDGRNNGINGVTVIGGYLWVSGAFYRVGNTDVGHLARFRTL
ncbi:hypothetical protein, partial [Solicola sp. PLA-1-18]|uniref:hypothetical protein n=1 Tax=Solicola sp. PLA-1-18 TaxID=3380532 RepID=UPI003B7E6BCD